MQVGDLIIVYESFQSLKPVILTANGRLDNRFGSFLHKEWVGKPFGTKAFAAPAKGGGYGHNSQSSGWVHLLAPTPELWSLSVRHRTQILYVADISLICFNLELSPGGIVLESGTGSGSLTHSLVRAVAPVGHVHSFEFHAQRSEEAAKELAEHGMAACVTVTTRNIEELGFPESLEGRADAVFLDLPGPWKVVPSAASCLKPDGRFCSFSPCIEQVSRTAEALAANGFCDITTVECILRQYEVRQETLIGGPLPRPQVRQHHRQPAAAAAAATTTPSSKPTTAPDPSDSTSLKRSREESLPGGIDASRNGDGESKAQGAAASPAEVTEQQAEVGAEVEAETAQEADVSMSEATDVVVAVKKEKAVVLKGDRKLQPVTNNISMVCARPAMEAKGHTGYLTFARKFVSQ
ncbi:MAG: hypothetical protein WDW38_008800 [Sanguina aurantia]